MNELPEYIGKAQFRNAGIPVPESQVVSTDSDREEYQSLTVDPPVAVKAQVPISGRGKKGGIVFAETTEAASEAISDLLGSTIAGKTVQKVLVEKRIQATDELYLSFAADGTNEQPVMRFSTKGGQNIESTNPSYITSRAIDPVTGVHQYHVQEVVNAVGGTVLVSTQDLYELAEPMWELFHDQDFQLLEINPIGITQSGDLYAMDAKCVIDNAARFRQNYEEVHTTLTDIEQRAANEGIDLKVGNGKIGIVSNGAGIALATLDYIDQNTDTSFSGFVDTHGAQFEKTYIQKSLHYLSECDSRAVIVNIQGPFIDCLPVAETLVRAVEYGYDQPVVARFKGYNAEEARQRCEVAGIEIATEITEAVQMVTKLQEVQS